MSATASSSPRPCSKAAASPSRPNAPARRRKSRNWRRKSSTGGDGAKSKRFGGLQHFFGVAVNLDLAPGSPDHAFAVDQEGRAFDAHVLLAVHAFFLPDLVFLGDAGGLVGGEGEGQLVFLLELVVTGDAVLGHADDHGVDA